MIIGEMHPDDWGAVREIYAEGIASGKATFDQEVPEWAAWDGAHLRQARLVARVDGVVAGWAALMPISPRPCYRGVGEVSVYVAAWARGRGVGLGLLTGLVAASEAAGIWTLHSSIHADNTVSQRMHERAGFRLIGRRERIALRPDGWADTILMERRSRVVGV